MYIWLHLKDAMSNKKWATESTPSIMLFNEMSKGKTTRLRDERYGSALSWQHAFHPGRINRFCIGITTSHKRWRYGNSSTFTSVWHWPDVLTACMWIIQQHGGVWLTACTHTEWWWKVLAHRTKVDCSRGVTPRRIWDLHHTHAVIPISMLQHFSGCSAMM